MSNNNIITINLEDDIIKMDCSQEFELFGNFFLPSVLYLDKFRLDKTLEAKKAVEFKRINVAVGKIVATYRYVDCYDNRVKMVREIVKLNMSLSIK